MRKATALEMAMMDVVEQRDYEEDLYLSKINVHKYVEDTFLEDDLFEDYTNANEDIERIVYRRW